MASAVADIMLRLGSSLGPGGFASLESGIRLVGQFSGKIVSTVKELDRFSRVMDTVNMSMVNYADNAAKGQIDTYELMKSLQAIQHAFKETGVEITSEQFKIMAQRATLLAQATGRDATQSFQQLAESVSKGTTRALKEYGIYVAQGTDLGKTQREILQKLTEGHGDLSVEVKTTTERVQALTNVIGTLSGVLYNNTESFDSLGTVLDIVNENLSKVVTAMTEGQQAVRDLAKEVDGAGNIVKDFNRDLVDTISLTSGPGGGFGGQFGAMAMSGQILKAIEQRDRAIGTAKQKDVTLDELEKLIEDEYFGEYSQADIRKGAGTGLELYMSDLAKKRQGGGKKSNVDDELEYLEWKDEQRRKRTEEMNLAATPVIGEQEQMRIDIEQKRLAEFMEAEKRAEEEEEKYRKHRQKFMEKMAQQSYAGSTGLEGYFDTTQGMIAQSGLSGTDRESAMAQSIANLDKQIEAAQTMEDIRADHYDAWLERIGEERIWQLQQIQFASDFKSVWRDALDGISAGTMAAQGTMDLLRGTWNAAVENAITGQRTFRAALRNIVKDVGMAIAKEAGWRALMEFAHAIAAAATYQYGKAAKHAAAGGMYTALAVTAGVASAAMHRSTSVESGGGTVSETARGTGFGGGTSAYGQTYPEGGGAKEVHHYFHFEADKDKMFSVVMDQNSSQARSGGESFAMAG